MGHPRASWPLSAAESAEYECIAWICNWDQSLCSKGTHVSHVYVMLRQPSTAASSATEMNSIKTDVTLVPAIETAAVCILSWSSTSLQLNLFKVVSIAFDSLANSQPMGVHCLQRCSIKSTVMLCTVCIAGQGINFAVIFQAQIREN